MLATSIAMTSTMPGMSSGTSMSFDHTLVGLSFVISVFGSLAGLLSARRARTRAGGLSFAWLAAVAVSIGGGAVWSMHFIGMLAYHYHVTFSVSPGWTLLSLVVAIAAFGAGLYIASRGKRSARRYVGAGTITGLGVAGMHYLGMYALQMNASLNFRLWIVGLSLLIAVVAASLALFFVLTVTSIGATVAASVVMAIGICAMHYTAMAAAIVSPHLELTTSSTASVDPLSLALAVFGIASVLLFVLLFVVLFDDADRSEPLAVPQPG